MTIFDDNFWWQFFITIFDDNFLCQFLMTIFDDNFDANFLCQFLMTIFDDHFLWQFFMTIFDDNFWWQFLMKLLRCLWPYIVHKTSIHFHFPLEVKDSQKISPTKTLVWGSFFQEFNLFVHMFFTSSCKNCQFRPSFTSLALQSIHLLIYLLRVIY